MHPRMADSFVVHGFEYIFPTWNLGDNPRMDLYDPGSMGKQATTTERHSSTTWHGPVSIS